MGRRTDIDNEDDEQQSISSNSSSTITTRLVHESQLPSHEEKFDDDSLIQDKILPHRKRVRRDTLLSIQQTQRYSQPPPSESSLSTDCKLEHVSILNRKAEKRKFQISQSSSSDVLMTFFFLNFPNNTLIKLTLNALQYAVRERERERVGM